MAVADALNLVICGCINLGPQGVFLAVAISESTSALIAIVLFRRNTWKLIKI